MSRAPGGNSPKQTRQQSVQAHAPSNISEMQLTLPFGPIINREFLANHWLNHRLPLEPEWDELENEAKEAATALLALWGREKNRVELYGNEAALEEKFIQPVFEILGWKL